MVVLRLRGGSGGDGFLRKAVVDLEARLDSLEARVKGYNKALENMHERLVRLEKSSVLDDLVDLIGRDAGVAVIACKLRKLMLLKEEKEINGFIDNDRLYNEINELRKQLRNKILRYIIDYIEYKLLER